MYIKICKYENYLYAAQIGIFDDPILSQLQVSSTRLKSSEHKSQSHQNVAWVPFCNSFLTNSGIFGTK